MAKIFRDTHLDKVGVLDQTTVISASENHTTMPGTFLKPRSGKIRVLHVYRTYFPDTQGGLEEAIRQICINTKPQGAECRVFSLSSTPDPKRMVNEEADVYRVKTTLDIASCGISLRALREFKRHVAWADIVHYHFPWPFADFLHFYCRVKKPVLVTYHSDIIRQKLLLKLYNPLRKWFLGSVDRIVSTSSNYFATSATLDYYSSKVDVVPLAICRKSYPKVKDDILSTMEDKVGRDFFLFVGVMRYYKGLHILIDAVAGTDIPVVIVGAGPVEEQIQKRAKEKGVHNVVFLGHVPDDVKVALIKLSYCMVFPSYMRSEAFGMTLLEGAMFAKPLISTEIGTGTSYINIHNDTGLVVPPGDHQLLRDAMVTLRSNPDKAKGMGQNALARYEKLFSGEKMGIEYVRIYNELL